MKQKKHFITKCIICLIILNLCPLVEGLFCTKINEEFVCNIPIEINIDEPKIEIFLSKTQLSCEYNKSIDATLNIINPSVDTIEYDVYHYVYQGTKCLSCINERNETLKKIKLNPSSKVQVFLKINCTFLGNQTFKVKYKKSDLITWKEFKGTIFSNKLTNKSNEVVFNQNIVLSSDGNIVNDLELGENMEQINLASLNEPNFLKEKINAEIKNKKDFLSKHIVLILICIGASIVTFVFFKSIFLKKFKNK